ncbi:hypothetical protein AU381_26025 [Sinorhizobium glycinis]|uniref:Uncharacterized protein n=1 Tax=Sinorhizobium glycinis TaxID=1472378 RepID=A0A178XKS4_9HYPH|nr:hypothetical protein AU381_26025 [Sinorhizobium glycinis]
MEDFVNMKINAVQQVQEDMALIARGEEIDLPWRRLRVLLDYGLVEISTLSSWVDRLQEVEHPSRGQTRV